MAKRKSNEIGSSSLCHNDDNDDDYESVPAATEAPTAKRDCSKDEPIVEKKIRKIIETTFDEEINYKKYELEKINEVDIDDL